MMSSFLYGENHLEGLVNKISSSPIMLRYLCGRFDNKPQTLLVSVMGRASWLNLYCLWWVRFVMRGQGILETKGCQKRQPGWLNLSCLIREPGDGSDVDCCCCCLLIDGYYVSVTKYRAKPALIEQDLEQKG